MKLVTAAFVFLLTVSQAIAANRYIDNRQAIANGVAQASGSTTTTLKISTFTLNTAVAPTNPDLVNMGINVLSGTSAPASSTGFKITAVDNTDPAHPVLTVHTSFGATPADNWNFIVSYGCNANTTFTTQTKGASLTGPKLTLYQTYNNSSSGDVIYVRGGGPDYNGSYDAGSAPLIFNGNGRNITVEGFSSSPGDLYLAAGVRADASNSTNFPYINISASSTSLNAGSGLSSATSISLRNLKINNGASGGYALKNDGAGASWAVTECLLGTTDMAANGTIFADTTTSGVTKAFTFTECTWFTENCWITANCCANFSVTDCDMTATIASTANHAIQLNSAEGNATNHILKATFDDITMVYNGTSSTATIFRPVGLTHCNPLKLSNITATYQNTGGFFIVYEGISNLLIENCTITGSAAVGAGTMIGIGQDTQSVQFGCGEYATVLHSAAASAAGTGNTTLGGTSFILSSTGSPSSVDDFYIDRFLRFPSHATLRLSRITGYVGATRTVTIYGVFEGAFTAPAYEIVKFTQISSSVVIRNNTLTFTGDRSHCLLFGQGCDGAIAQNNRFYNGDYSIVIKAEDCQVIGNYATGEQPMILKGASRNRVEFNTFYCTAVGAAPACFGWLDQSSAQNDLHGNREFSKCNANIVQNNIIAVAPGISSNVMGAYELADGVWAEDADDGVWRQNNRIDNNLYFLGSGSVFAVNYGVNINTFADWKTKMANIEADGLPYCKMYPLNDANSFYADPLFVDPGNNNFALKPASPARRRASMTGMNIGAWQLYNRGGSPGVNN